MKPLDTPENGAVVKFKRIDEDQWRDGEFDLENKMFIEIYSAELTTHNLNDISAWEPLAE